MNATGLFFLRSAPYRAVTRAGDYTWLLPLVERLEVGGAGSSNTTGYAHECRHVVAHWCGPGAATFIDANRERLKAGCALTLDLRNLRCIGGEINADITGCSLAPARWPCSNPNDPRQQPQAAVHGAVMAAAPSGDQGHVYSRSSTTTTEAFPV